MMKSAMKSVLIFASIVLALLVYGLLIGGCATTNFMAKPDWPDTDQARLASVGIFKPMGADAVYYSAIGMMEAKGMQIAERSKDEGHIRSAEWHDPAGYGRYQVEVQIKQVGPHRVETYWKQYVPGMDGKYFRFFDSPAQADALGQYWDFQLYTYLKKKGEL